MFGDVSYGWTSIGGEFSAVAVEAHLSRGNVSFVSGL